MRQLSCGKVPVVCAIVESVTERGVDAGVTLRDPTGNSSALIHCCQVSSVAVSVPSYSAEFTCGLQVVMRGICRWTMRSPSAVCEQSLCSFLIPLGKLFIYVPLSPCSI